MSPKQIIERLEELTHKIQQVVDNRQGTYEFHHKEGAKEWQSIEDREYHLEFQLGVLQSSLASLAEDIQYGDLDTHHTKRKRNKPF